MDKHFSAFNRKIKFLVSDKMCIFHSLQLHIFNNVEIRFSDRIWILTAMANSDNYVYNVLIFS